MQRRAKKCASGNISPGLEITDFSGFPQHFQALEQYNWRVDKRGLFIRWFSGWGSRPDRYHAVVQDLSETLSYALG